MGRNRKSIGKARYANFKARVEQEYADELIGELSDPLAPLSRVRHIPIRRGNGAMAMLAVPRDGELADPMEQLELDFKPAAESVVVARSSSVAEDGDRLQIPMTALTPAPAEPAPHAPPIVTTRRTAGPTAAPVIRMVPRTAAPQPATETPFSLRRFAVGCLAGTGAAAMVLIAIRALVS